MYFLMLTICGLMPMFVKMSSIMLCSSWEVEDDVGGLNRVEGRLKFRERVDED